MITVSEDGYSLLNLAVCGNLVWMVRIILGMVRDQLTSSNQKAIYNMFNAHEQGTGFTCVHEAAGIAGAHECLSLLINYNEKYFDGNMVKLDAGDLNGRTALMIACLNGNVHAVNALLDAESTVDCNKCDNNGNSVLLYAVESGKAEVVETLVRHPVHCRLLDHDELLRAKEAAKAQRYRQIDKMLGDVYALLNAKSSTLYMTDEEDLEDSSD